MIAQADIGTVPVIGGPISGGAANRVLYEDASNQLAESANLTYDGSTLGLKGDLDLLGASSGTLTLQAAGATTNHTLTLPSAQGGASTVLTNDGAGALSWAAGGGNTLDAAYDQGGPAAGRAITLVTGSPVELRDAALGEATSSALLGTNITPATVTVNQWGPVIGSAGRTWETGTGTSDITIAGFYAEGVDNTAAEVDLVFVQQLNGGGYTETARIKSDSSIVAGANTDTTNIFGRARLDSRVTDNAYFSHYDYTASTEYALTQTGVGTTILNAVSGKTILLAVAGSQKFVMETTLFRANVANGPAILNEASANNNPTLCPDRAQPTSGIGGSGATVTIVVSGSEVLKAQSSSVVIRQDLIPVGADLGSASLPWTDFYQDGQTSMAEMAAPSGLANNARIFAVDNGGKTELNVIFGTGGAIQLAIEA